MMFEGTPVAPKGTLTRVIEGGGGVLNGSTRYDYTNYIASAPGLGARRHPLARGRPHEARSTSPTRTSRTSRRS